jgi:phosphohistidine swiveling domain-containing protein
MADKALADFLKKQISLTEWLEKADADYVDAFRKEDVDKRKTLKKIADIIGIPVGGEYLFEAVDVHNRTGQFEQFYIENKNNSYAMRLLPKKPGLEKLRLRGVTLADLVQWFEEQPIEHVNYEVNVIEHRSDNQWATIFFINQHGIHGEMIYGGHHLLTQGFHGDNVPIVFHYNFKGDSWLLSREEPDAEKFLKGLVAHIKVTDIEKRNELEENFGATFYNQYLAGYFETSDSSLGTWFIDYNQTLGEKLSEVSFQKMLNDENDQIAAVVKGRSGSQGEATGRVRIVNDPQDTDFSEGEVLVCTFTSPDYLSCIQKSVAIVTDQGGTLSHAAIVARELQKPCIVATGNATEILFDGDLVCVNADAGTVIKVS